MSKSDLALLFLTISMCTQRISIAVGNIFLGIALLTFFIFLYDKHKQKMSLFNKEYFSYYVVYGIFLLFILPSVFFAGHFPISFKNFMEMWIYRFMPFVIITNLNFKEKFWQKCLLALLVYVSFDGMVALCQMLITGSQRTEGLGDGLLRFSSILVMVLPVAIILWLEKIEYIQKRFLPLCTLAILCGTIGTESRGAWLVSAGILLLVLLKYLGSNFKKVAVIVLCALCIAGIAGSSQRIRARFFSINNITTDRSNGDRIEGWKSAWIMFQEKPVVGWGLNQSNEPYRAKYRSKAETQGLNHFHNNYVEMAVNTGVIGFIGYMFLVIGWLWIHRDWSKGYNVAISLAWLAFHAFGMIEYNVDLSACIKTLWFVMGLLACLRVQAVQKFYKNKKYKKIFVDGIMHLGDMVMTASIFPVLKKAFPQAEITYLSSGNLSFAAEMLPGVDRVIPYTYKSKGGFWDVYKIGKQLKQEHFDLGISLDPRERVTLMKWFADIPCTISMEQALGWELRWEKLFYDFDLSYQQPWDYKEHLMSVSFQTLMRQFVGDTETTFYPLQLKPSATEDLSYAQDLLKSNTAAKGLKIAFCFETTEKDKDWPTEKFSEVCNYLVSKYAAMLIMTGVEKQRTMVQKVVNGLQAKDHVLDVVGKTNFKQLVALCRNIDLVLTVDTGTAHIAAAAGCPVVTIFTHNSPKIYQAAGKNSAAVSGKLSCSGKGVKWLSLQDKILVFL